MIRRFAIGLSDQIAQLEDAMAAQTPPPQAGARYGSMDAFPSDASRS
jgi:hypothetical protein